MLQENKNLTNPVPPSQHINPPKTLEDNPPHFMLGRIGWIISLIIAVVSAAILAYLVIMSPVIVFGSLFSDSHSLDSFIITGLIAFALLYISRAASRILRDYRIRLRRK